MALADFFGLPSGAQSGQGYATLGAGIGDIFTGIGEGYKAEGMELEAKQYQEASRFATLEAQIQHNVTTVNEAQAIRQGYQGIGASKAGAAGSGFSSAGSAGDILRSSTQQAALGAAVTEQTGEVAEIGYKEQAKSYETMAEAAKVAAKADTVGEFGSFVTGAVKTVGALTMMGL